MSKFRVEINHSKCQGYGKCTATAPAFFARDDTRKVRLVGNNETTDDVVVKAAQACPYRAIAVVDADTGGQIFPAHRLSAPHDISGYQ
jgi:ferredoxin